MGILYFLALAVVKMLQQMDADDKINSVNRHFLFDSNITKAKLCKVGRKTNEYLNEKLDI
jgi:hypothetical protein